MTDNKKVIVSKDKLDTLADVVNSKTGAQGALTIDKMISKIREIDKKINLITSNFSLVSGYYSLSYGKVATITTSYNPHYHFDKYIPLEEEKVYTIEVPNGIEWNFCFFDNDLLYRGGVEMSSTRTSYNFVCPPNIRYLAIVVKYIGEQAIKKFMGQIRVYENKDYNISKIELNTIFNDVGNWKHSNIIYSPNKTFEDNLNGTNSSYCSYNLPIKVNMKGQLFIANFSPYPSMNIQCYEEKNSQKLAKQDWATTNIGFLNFLYDYLALTPWVGSSEANLDSVLESYKKWFNIYTIERKDFTDLKIQ